MRKIWKGLTRFFHGPNWHFFYRTLDNGQIQIYSLVWGQSKIQFQRDEHLKMHWAYLTPLTLILESQIWKFSQGYYDWWLKASMVAMWLFQTLLVGIWEIEIANLIFLKKRSNSVNFSAKKMFFVFRLVKIFGSIIWVLVQLQHACSGIKNWKRPLRAKCL